MLLDEIFALRLPLCADKEVFIKVQIRLGLFADFVDGGRVGFGLEDGVCSLDESGLEFLG